MSAKPLFYDVSKRLGAIPSFAYGFMYLLLIPIFAIIFNSLLPFHFYHATIKYEKDFKDTQSMICNELKESIFDHYDKNVRPKLSVDDKWRLLKDEISIKNIEYDDSRNLITFEMRMTVIHLSSFLRRNIIDCKVMLTVDPFSTPWPPPYNRLEDLDTMMEFRMFRGLGIIETRSWYKPDVNPGFVFDSEYKKNKRFIIPKFSSFEKKLFDYIKGTKGFASKLEDNFWRMFYLSAITITTLGFGDIVPISTVSRILVSIEAFLGIILIGLFLNSLAQENKK